MLKLRIGAFSPINQHVIVSIENSFSIEDINPTNTPGQPKFECIVEGSYFQKGIEDIPHIDTEVFQKSFSELISFLKQKQKNGKKINIVIKNKILLSLDLLTILFLFSEKEKDFNITVFISKEDMFKVEKLKTSIEEVKSFVQQSGDLKPLAYAFQNNILNIYQEAVAKKTISDISKNLSGKKVVIIDTHNFYYRNYFGMPTMNNSSGTPTSVIKALTILLKGLMKDKPDYIVFASEDKAGVKEGIRYRLYNQYKANREKTEDELKEQIRTCENLLEKIGFKIVSERGFEADDIVGSYAKYFENLGAEVYIHTTDKDMYQLISDKVKIYNPMKNIIIGENGCREKFLVSPDKVIYSLALAGDTSDNVPGVKGIGPKKAASLIEQFQDIEGIYKNIESISGAVQKYLKENKENAFVSLDLVKIYTFLANDIELSDFLFPSFNLFDIISEELKVLEIGV